MGGQDKKGMEQVNLALSTSSEIGEHGAYPESTCSAPSYFAKVAPPSTP